MDGPPMHSSYIWIMTKRPFLAYLVVIAVCFSLISTEKSYKLHLDKFVPIYMADTVGDFSNVKVAKYNRSASALNGTFELYTDLREDALFTLEGYEKIANEYVLSGIQVKEAVLCEVMDKYGAAFKLPQYNVTTNLKFKCPVTKGSYYVQNYRPDEESMPDDVPGRFWRFDVKARYPDDLDNPILHFQAFMHIERKVTNIALGMM